MPVEFKTDLKSTLVRLVRVRAEAAGAELVVTSRLDDDDALRLDAFERVHEEMAEFQRESSQPYAVFSLSVGCMWLPSKRLGYTRYHDSHSPNLSLVESAARCQGIYSRPHKEIKQQLAPRGAYLRGIDGDTRWWLYAAHSLADSEPGDTKRVEKIVNHKYGYWLDDELLATFGIDPEGINELGHLPDPPVVQGPSSFRG